MTNRDAPPSAPQECYGHGCEEASEEAGVPLATFPPACPRTRKAADACAREEYCLNSP